jgi:hypothetical protein
VKPQTNNFRWGVVVVVVVVAVVVVVVVVVVCVVLWLKSWHSSRLVTAT